jgi:hypothetical protein
MTERSTRSGWFVPVAVLLALVLLRGAACRKKPAPGQPPAVTPASKDGWITPLLTAPPPMPTFPPLKNATPVPTEVG